MNYTLLIPPAAALILAPLMFGVINRTKAFFAGRKGQPLLQLYFDLFKLLRKGATYSRTTTWIFRAAPLVGLSSVLMALLIVPMGGVPALFSFQGDLALFAYLLCLMRFVTILAALDTGSSFEGMGASREAFFSALAEPALLLGLAVIAHETQGLSLSGMLGAMSSATWHAQAPALALTAVAVAIVLLAENSRIPVDDPNTHLELTMIHEVMILDYSGPDLAFVLYGAALKLWVLAALLVGIALPIHVGNVVAETGVFLAGMLVLAVLIGVVESSMARLRMVRVPHMLAGATALVVLALALVLR